MLTLPTHGRYHYSVIGERKDYSWPDGKRLAFCLTIGEYSCIGDAGSR